MDCLFCKIAAGVIPSKTVFQDEQCFAIADINPQSPVHFLVIPQEHIASTAHTSPAHARLLGHLLVTAAQIARDKGIDKGYRIVINTGPDGGQTVDHLHVHVLGGRHHTWPPG